MQVILYGRAVCIELSRCLITEQLPTSMDVTQHVLQVLRTSGYTEARSFIEFVLHFVSVMRLYGPLCDNVITISLHLQHDTVVTIDYYCV